MKVAIIPARGGSRRIPRKNIRLFHGKPILAYSVETAYESKLFDFVFVSTDDREIASVAQQCGANILWRDESYGAERYGTQDIAKLSLEQLGERGVRPEYACVIYATAPLMAEKDLRRGFDVMIESGHRFAFSICDDPLSDAAQFYWGDVEAFLEPLPIFSEHSAMIPVAKSRVCDINVESDWARAEAMYSALNRRAA